MSLILDAGALLAIERLNRDVMALLKSELLQRRVPITHGGIIGQVWRGGSGRQANLARVLTALEIAPLDDALGRRAGILLGRARTSDVIDAAIVLLARDGDTVLTSDAVDLEPLATLVRVYVDIVPV